MRYVHADKTVDEQEARGATWRLPTSRLALAPGERRTCGFSFVWAADYAAGRATIAGAGLVDVEVVPGTVAVVEREGLPLIAASTAAFADRASVTGRQDAPDRVGIGDDLDAALRGNAVESITELHRRH